MQFNPPIWGLKPNVGGVLTAVLSVLTSLCSGRFEVQLYFHYFITWTVW